MKTLADTQLSRLADQYGTPLWVYDGQLIKKRVQQLAAFDTVRFAQKACSNLHILRLLRDAGAAVDAVSLGELERALHAGFSAQTAQGTAGVVFTADVFD
ncbi:diaminopimelate decarboxylase, partial [Pseudomonas syringae pv. actinidiae ICMP 18804]